MKYILLLVVLFVYFGAYAGSFGGSRSNNSRSSSPPSRPAPSRPSAPPPQRQAPPPPQKQAAPPPKSSTFGGNRSSDKPATVTRPSQPQTQPQSRQQAAPPTVVHNTTVYRDSGPSYFNSWMFWHAARPRPIVIYTNGVPYYNGQVVDPAQVQYVNGEPTLVQQEESHLGTFVSVLLCLAVFGLIGYFLVGRMI